VSIAELPKKLGEAAAEEDAAESQEESNALSGITVRELTPELAKRFGAKEGDAGVVVVRSMLPARRSKRAFGRAMWSSRSTRRTSRRSRTTRRPLPD